MELRTYIGKQIKKYRLRNGMNQEDLAEKLNTTKQSISRYENGERKTDQDILFNLADIFGVSINDFFPAFDETGNIVSRYNYLPTSISAGIPTGVDAFEEFEQIELPDVVMGKYAGNGNIIITKINGESMNKIIPHDSLIAVRPVSTIHDLKTGDIVVYRKDGEYAVKRLVIYDDKWIFKPESTDDRFYDDVIYKDADVKIKGKVVLYIVEV